MIFKILLTLLLLLSFTSCTDNIHKPIKISATTWVGYTPLFYAKAKGWLDPLQIKLINVSSLSENMNVYKAGKSDAYVGTQYEFTSLQDENLIPIYIFDRSNGGDVIMSNQSIETLQKTDKPIEAHLEIDSVNSTLLDDFVGRYNLSNKKIHLINQDQTQISIMSNEDKQKNSLIVTYIPYNYTLEKNGFRELASTKDNLNLLVIDAMFTSKKVLLEHKEQFVALKKLMDDSIENLKNDPKEFYETIKPYLLDLSYQEFEASMQDIIWINKDLSKPLKSRLEASNFPLRSLLSCI